MIVELLANLNEVNFAPKTEELEVIQNVRTILTTLKKTVPMDREFGIDGEIIDLPIAVTQARTTSEIVSAVNKFEPRAKVVSVDYSGKEQDGTLVTKVKVSIDGTKKSA